MLLNMVKEDLKSHMLAEKWLGYLLQYVDHKELEKLMNYYEKIGWISAESKEKLLKMAEGITSSGKGSWKLPSRVHLTSLLFITYLAGMDIPKDIYGLDTYVRIFTENPEEMFSI